MAKKNKKNPPPAPAPVQVSPVQPLPGGVQVNLTPQILTQMNLTAQIIGQWLKGKVHVRQEEAVLRLLRLQIVNGLTMLAKLFPGLVQVDVFLVEQQNGQWILASTIPAGPPVSGTIHGSVSWQLRQRRGYTVNPGQFWVGIPNFPLGQSTSANCHKVGLPPCF